MVTAEAITIASVTGDYESSHDVIACDDAHHTTTSRTSIPIDPVNFFQLSR
jgi:hypothetical protein